MITNRLEKNVILYKNQFEKLILDIYQEHRMERLSIDLDAILFRIRYMIKHDPDQTKMNLLKEEFVQKALELRNIFGEVMYNLLVHIIGFQDKFSKDDIVDILSEDVTMDGVNVTFKLIVLSDNLEYLEFLDKTIEDDKPFNLFPGEFFRYYVDSYNDGIAKAYPELFENKFQDKIGTGDDHEVFCHSFTFQTSEYCSLNCVYCYQFNKTKTKMTFNTAKKFIDELLADHYGYLNRYNSPAIILEFIGGEPLLEINLTRKIYEYFLEQTYKLDHPWFKLHRVSICSNGLSYFDKEVQDFFKEYAQNISFNISIDGAKDLHDACRIQPNGEGSYDVDMIALNHYNKHHTPERNSKMTIAPGNLKYLFDSVVHFIQNGMKTINLNCVFEEGWNETTAKEEYYQLKKLADYIVENNLEYIYLSIFSEKQESINAISFDGNECGGTGAMLSLRPNGQFYPCIRYMPSSVGSNVEDLCIGTIDKGIIGRTQNSEILKKLDNITRRSKTNDICFECPIASNCAGCSALGHTVYGTANKKTTFHCIQHIAETLANVYFWNRLLLAHPDYDLDVRKNNVPPSWAKIILDDDELEELRLIELAAMATKLEYSEGGEYGNE